MRFAPLPRRGFAAAILAGLAALAAPGSARAAFVADSTVNIQSGTPAYGGGGTFTGTVGVQKIDATHATVQISLTNTSASQYLTSLGFSLPGTVSAVAFSDTGVSAAWQVLGDGGSTPYSNSSDFNTGFFGAFDVGAGVGSTWHSAGMSSNGIAPGATGTFTFAITDTVASTITAQALLTYTSTNGSPGIGVRFRNYSTTNYTTGTDSSGTKVLAVAAYTPPPPPPPPGTVPAPPAVLLALAGVGCLFGRNAFRRKTAPAVA